MAQRMLHESSQHGRSVLGTLAVQIEKDPKTGNTTVTSVTPMPTADGAPKATILFDDGRKSISAVGTQENQPSSEELGQILSVIDGIGMGMVLENVTSKAEAKREQKESHMGTERKGLRVGSCKANSEEGSKVAGFGSSNSDPQPLRVSCASSMDSKAGKSEDRSIVTLEDIARETGSTHVQNLEHDPVTLVFMGYRDSVSDKGHGDEVDSGMLIAERVIITDDGEEYVLGQETSSKTGKESETPVSLDVGPEGNGAAHEKVQGEKDEKALCESTSPKIGKQRRGGPSSCKKCQCCVVM